MLIKKTVDIPASEITPETIYLARRDFMRGTLSAGILGAGIFSVNNLLADPNYKAAEASNKGPEWLSQKIAHAQADKQTLSEVITPYESITGHNNFYEFGYEKTDPAKNAQAFKPHPWQVEISGEIAKPGKYNLEDLLKGMDLEERVYRLRCVEAWSMVIPWVGFSLASLLKRFEPTSKAKYVSFVTLEDSKQFPAQKSALSTIDWPYREGLRIDEAMHPLTILAVGLYGKSLPNQNGAPLRLVVPWKYGFKSIKSIVKIELTEHQPQTTWNQIAPNEYGFFANVNPNLDHPRWSQAKERRLPSGLFSPNIMPTQLFNGYGSQVASLYKDMDLKKYY
jgi:methionine sulfoxide reductase catalytic subunit